MKQIHFERQLFLKSNPFDEIYIFCFRNGASTVQCRHPVVHTFLYLRYRLFELICGSYIIFFLLFFIRLFFLQQICWIVKRKGGSTIKPKYEDYVSDDDDDDVLLMVDM